MAGLVGEGPQAHPCDPLLGPYLAQEGHRARCAVCDIDFGRARFIDMDNDIDKPQKKSAKHDSGAADLEKVTDYAEEREVLAQDISGAINLIDSRRNKEAAEKLAKERELAKVSIKKEDVEVLVNKGYTY